MKSTAQKPYKIQKASPSQRYSMSARSIGPILALTLVGYGITAINTVKDTAYSLMNREPVATAQSWFGIKRKTSKNYSSKDNFGQHPHLRDMINTNTIDEGNAPNIYNILSDLEKNPTPERPKPSEHVKAIHGPLLYGADTNGDGKISPSELVSPKDMWFEGRWVMLPKYDDKPQSSKFVIRYIDHNKDSKFQINEISSYSGNHKEFDRLVTKIKCENDLNPKLVSRVMTLISKHAELRKQ